MWTDSIHIAVTVTGNDIKTGAEKSLVMISCFDEADSTLYRPMQRRMVGANELEEMWETAIMAYLKY
jgi:hypothetical protein